MRTRVSIDPNVRVSGNQTYAGFEDVDGVLVVGAPVEVWERESAVAGEGCVTEIDWDRALVYVAVNWGSLREMPDGSQDRPARSPTLIMRVRVSAPIEVGYSLDCDWRTNTRPAVVSNPRSLAIA